MHGDGLEFQLPRRPFGLIVPNEAGINYVHQAGGVAITYPSVRGVYLPLSDPTLLFERPPWYTRGETDVTDFPVDALSDEERSRLPDDVLERGGFDSEEAFSDWLDASPVYGNIDLLSELTTYNYYAYNTTADDPVLDRWEDETEIWAEIDEQLLFTYEEYDYDTDPKNTLPEDAPKPMEALKWIEITGTKTQTKTVPQLSMDDGSMEVDEEKEPEEFERKLARWAEEIEGMVVAMVYPNCD